MLTKQLAIICCLLFFTRLSDAQDMKSLLLKDSASFELENPKYISVFFLLGHNYSGFRSSLKTGMERSGFNRIQYTSFGNERVRYPVVQERLEMGIGIAAGLSSRSGISAKIELKDWIKVFGYNINDGEFAVESQLRTVSLNYIYRFKGNKHEVTLGPTLFNHFVKASNNQKNEEYGLGFEITHIYKINNFRKPWELGFKTEFCWIPEQEIGPFDTDLNDIFRAPNVKPPLLSIGILLGLGWKTKR